MIPRRLNIRLPRTWNQLTNEELEIVAGVIIEDSKASLVRKDNSSFPTKVKLFFALAGINIISMANPRVPVEKQYYMCCMRDTDVSLWKRIRNFFVKEDIEPFQLYTEQIKYWVDQNMGWFDKEPELTVFPYQRLRRGLMMKEFDGPGALMQDFSWKRYRFAQDYMQYYTVEQNKLVRMRSKRFLYSEDDKKKQEKIVDLAKAMFLATIFCKKVNYIEDEKEERKVRRDFRYTSNQSTDNAQYFRNFPDVKFQVILIWWTSMMYYLQRKFPHCYKSQDAKSDTDKGNPLDLYMKQTAVLEKYTHANEKEINDQTFLVVLQHMENMAKEAEEIEKMNKKIKTNKKK